jgi:hypothetical protein
MKWINASLCFLTFSLPVFSASAQVQAQSLPVRKTWQISQVFKPPERGTPTTTIGGASRGSACLKEKKALKGLIPENKLGLTFAEHPTFYWSVPPTTVKTAQLTLFTDQDKKVHYETTLTIPNKAGIISFTIPANAPPLKVGKTYHWYLSLICDELDFSNNPRVEGWVERTQPESPLLEKLAKADLQKLPTLYAEAGIWYEALDSLVQLRRSQPNDLKTRIDWRQFLNSVGLSAIAYEPLIDCCQPQN